jgi:hypothetical protein
MLEEVFGGVVACVAGAIEEDKAGLAGAGIGSVGWRSGLDALEALTRVKPIASMVRTFSRVRTMQTIPKIMRHLPNCSTLRSRWMTSGTLQKRLRPRLNVFL